MDTISGYKKEFDTWNIRKKATDGKNAKPPLFKERDIWWVSIGVNIGFEQDGKHEKFIRPVLVIKKFNRELFFGIPLSTKVKDNPYYFVITVKGRNVSALLSQARTFSSRRIEDKLAELDHVDYRKTLHALKLKLFSLPSSFEEGSRG